MSVKSYFKNLPEYDKYCRAYFGGRSFDVSHLKGDGSERQYFRVTCDNSSVILCINKNIEVNKRYLLLSQFFYPSIATPYVYSVNSDCQAYIMQDMGDLTMKSALEAASPSKKLDLYRQSIDCLLNFYLKGTQIVGKFPTYFSEFNIGKDCIDLFRRHFLSYAQPSHIFPDTVNHDLNLLLDMYAKAKANGLVMGDFQPRNIICNKGIMVLIDFQDAFIGNIMYDVASLLMSGSVPPTYKEREILLRYFFEKCDQFQDNEENRRQFYLFIILRRIRSMGTYAKLRAHKNYYRKRLEACIIEFTALESLVLGYIRIPCLFSYLKKLADGV